ncbi:MAG: YceI family protein [Saonia sp.]
MKSFTIILFLALATTILVAQKKPLLTNGRISFTFISKDVSGSIAGFESKSYIDLDNPSNSKFKGSVAVETLKTGISFRDWHLKGRKYFVEKEYPRITFESTEVKSDGGIIKVTGKLTIKDISKTTLFQFQQKGKQLIGTTTLYTSDFGIDIKKNRADNKVTVKIVLDVP